MNDQTITQRTELLFVYDATGNNPNGDPLELNRPRVDPDTGHNLVTDVRLKRTIRDFLIEERGYDGSDGAPGDVYVRELPSDSGKGLKDGKARTADFGSSEDEVRTRATATCIDIRLFGATMPIANSSVTLTGPVQFNLARSLNRVRLLHVKGTAAFASSEGKKQSSFREEDLVHYSVVPFYGAISPGAARDSRMTDADRDLLFDALWTGTKHLHSRSKLGHVPRLLVAVTYSDGSSFAGELQRGLRLVPNDDIADERDIRSVDDYTVAIDGLVARLDNACNGKPPFFSPVKIASIGIAHDPALRLTLDGELVSDLAARLSERVKVPVNPLFGGA
ncbi:MAG: type I-B CRISPR-associated protein Cas7/Csh2 [Acidobacteria bacterium]|nr:type I-B CRISPR-associated protein Cas7/Csh2 [Acidobacteriota bacterium]